MSFGHISIPTGPARFKAMRDFYQKSLAPLGFTVYAESTENEQPLAGGTAAGENGIRYLGLQTRDGKPEFWLHAGTKDVEPVTYDESRPHIEMEGRGLHLAWMVDSDEIVDEWYRVALQNGGTSNGEPGERERYSKGYYAAFVLDPLGNNIEVAHKNPS